MAKKSEKSFEKLLEETEDAVESIESGELSLDESLKKYEKGIENLRQCAKLITAAEEKVKVMVEKTEDEFTLQNFDPEDEEE